MFTALPFLGAYDTMPGSFIGKFKDAIHVPQCQTSISVRVLG